MGTRRRKARQLSNAASSSKDYNQGPRTIEEASIINTDTRSQTSSTSAAGDAARNVSEDPRWLSQLATPRGTALLTIVGIVVSALLTIVSIVISATPLFANSNFSRISFSGLIVLAAVLCRAAWHFKRRIRAGALAVLVAFSTVLLVRAFSTPQTQTFAYDGNVNPVPGIPYSGPGYSPIPLTSDPAQGIIVARITPDYSGDFQVSCTYQGIIDTGTRSTNLEWAHIVTGKFETFWVPVPFLQSLALGTAQSLLPCSNWRWRLNHFGLSD